MTCWTGDLIRLALVCSKGNFHRSGLNLIDKRPENVSIVIKAQVGWGSGRAPGLVKELESSSGRVAEPVSWLLPKVLRDCHGLVDL